MPIYEYCCSECHQVFEEWVTHSDNADSAVCPVCDSKAERIISNTSFVLKGGGWYVTDYGFKKDAPKASSESSSSASSAAPAAPAASTGTA